MLWLNNLKTRAAVTVKISLFVICVEVIIYFLSHNLHDRTFKTNVLNSAKLLKAKLCSSE